MAAMQIVSHVVSFPQSVPPSHPSHSPGPLADLVYGQLAARRVPKSREGPWTARARDVSLCCRPRRPGFGDLQFAYCRSQFQE
jgi:hypothetical protein